MRRRCTKWRARRMRAASVVEPSAPAKSRIEQAEQPVERRLVAAVRRRGQQEQVALMVLGQALQQLEALLAALMRADAGVRLVDDRPTRAGTGERCPAACPP